MFRRVSRPCDGGGDRSPAVILASRWARRSALAAIRYSPVRTGASWSAVPERQIREVRVRSVTRLSGGPVPGLPSFYNQGMRRGILERDAELSLLADAVREAVGSHGSVVLVMGEAGIGKSSLVEALRSHLPAEGRMLVGYCDDLATPRTLGPFRDLVGSVEPSSAAP